MSGSDDHPLAARLVPERALPPYSYVSGQFPHPIRDPAGHQFGQTSVTPPPLDAQTWQQSRAYLWACDLFNQGYYWEAHEEWEGLWNAVGRSGRVADFFKALIKLAAAGVKAREGRATGVQRHAARARQLLTEVRAASDAEDFLGLNIAALIDEAARLERDPPLARHSGAPVEILFGFALVPKPGR